MHIKGFFLNVISSYAHIVLSVLLNIMYVPIALHYMGVEKYGAWIVLQTLINYLTLANFGIPTAVTNLMSQSDSNNEKINLLLKGFKLLAIVCLAVFIIGLAFYLFVIYKTSWISQVSSEIRTSSVVLIVFFILRIPFQIASATFTANKKIFIAKIYDLLAIVVTFLSLLIAVYLNQNLIFLAFLSGILLLVLNVTSFFNALRIIDIRNFKKPINSIESKKIYMPGLALFASGMGALIVWNTDNIVISKFLGFQDVAIYSTAFRLFSIGYMSFGFIHGVLIPYYGQLFKQKSWDKLRVLFNLNLIAIPFIAMCVWLVGWLFSKDIIMLWLGNNKLYGGSNLYFILGAYGLVLGYVGVMFNLLTSLNLLKFLFYMTIAEAVINLCASVFLVNILGYPGVALGTLIASALVPFLFLPIMVNRNKELEFEFPFRILGTNVGFYSMIMCFLFFLRMDEYRFFIKVFIALVCLVLCLVFQYFNNKRKLTEVYKILYSGSKIKIG